MPQRKTAHVISHTHWDREWYLPYEKHHVRLIRLMDTLIDTLERDPEYRSFLLDGQTIILEDYLQVRPERKATLERLIREGRIHIGPWYILQDAFLTSGEANVRNLQLGHEDAARYGAIAKIGYFPDTFGNLGQAPQLMRQAGIDNAIFGRGVKPTGFNNTVSDAAYESSFSELIWEGPDGSRVLGILFANWYSNGNEIPVDPEEAAAYWERKLAEAEKYASTGELLFMNGCDHQPIQRDLSEALRTARRLFPDVEFVHSDFETYLASVRRALPETLSVVKGELRSQRTDGWSTLVNTASARVYLKQMNQRGQALLEKAAEPLATLASIYAAREYPHHLLAYAWKTLMQNHPHDSICGCSVDEVHREMVTRFEKSRHVAEAIVEESAVELARAIDTSAFAAMGSGAVPVVAFNMTGWERSGTVSVEVDAARIYFREGLPHEDMTRRMKAIDLGGRTLKDAEGRDVPCDVEDLGLAFGYDLPDDRFRQPYWCRRAKLTFEAERVPALGWKTYAWVKSAESQAASDEPAPADDVTLFAGERRLENRFLRVDVADDGSLTLTDKTTGRIYADLCVYEDTGDIGNEYMYKQPDGETPITTKGLPARIRATERAPYRAAIEIVHDWDVPASADASFEIERQEAVYYPERKAQRTRETVTLTMRTIVRLERHGRGVEIETKFDNRAKDHRMRALFPTDLVTTVHRADAVFEIPTRDNEPAAEWTNPSNCQHQQAFVDVSEADAGLTVANLGLNEYEVLRDGRNTIAVTLLRSVSELGDWGVFPTPEAQCLGEHTARLLLIPHGGEDDAYRAFAAAYQFQAPWTVAATDVHEGRLKSEHEPIPWSGRALAFSSLKRSARTDDVLLRWFHMGGEPSELKLRPEFETNGVYKSDILEQAGERPAVDADGSAALPVGACEIVTVGFAATASGYRES